jgi:hypothetical protein
MNESFSKVDIIIIIVLALLVAFIIGFNIIQIIDNKLNSVIINVPPQNCSVPSILVNFDKDNRPIKLNQEQMNILNNKVDNELTTNNIEGFNANSTYHFNNVNTVNNSNDSNDSNGPSELDHTVNTSDSDSNYNSNENFGNIEKYEHFGSLPDKYPDGDDSYINRFAQRISANLGNEIINNSNKINVQNPNYNTIDNYPYLIDPDNSTEGYYQSRVKLISDTSSPLLKLEELNMGKINQVLDSCAKNQPVQKVDETFDGYNKYPNLQTGSFANFTSIGKSLLTPYTSYPVAS